MFPLKNLARKGLTQVHVDSGNGLLPDNIQPLPELILTDN